MRDEIHAMPPSKVENRDESLAAGFSDELPRNPAAEHVRVPDARRVPTGSDDDDTLAGRFAAGTPLPQQEAGQTRRQGNIQEAPPRVDRQGRFMAESRVHSVPRHTSPSCNGPHDRSSVSRQRSTARTRLRSSLTGLAWLVAIVPTAPTPAHAYRTFADDPAVSFPAAWALDEISWDISTAELDEQRLPSHELVAALQTALATSLSTGCTPELWLIGTSTAPAAPGDGRNSIGVVASNWVQRGFPSGRGAMTDVQLERRADGTITLVEADIYLNMAAFQFVLAGPSSGELDLVAVLTHEVLHSLGLLHNCEQDGADGAPTCQPEHEGSALYPVYLGESGRTLSSDDIDGLCGLYPQQAPNCESSCPPGTACFDGQCLVPNAPECSPERSCRVGVCAVQGNSIGTCIREGATGSPCETGEDCDSLLCVHNSSSSYCTVVCTHDDECVGEQRCAEVAGRPICAPLPPSDGCTIAPGTRTTTLSWVWIAALAAGSRCRRCRGPVIRKS